MQAPKSLTALTARFRVVRFALVGLCNTALDFILLNVFIALLSSGHPSQKIILLCNTMSATIAAIVSFFLNKHFVFQAKHTPSYFIGYFLLITLAGLYLVQNIIVVISVGLLKGPSQQLSDFLSSSWSIHITSPFLALNAAKLVGTGVTLIWNYSLYKVFVFRVPHKNASDETKAKLL